MSQQVCPSVQVLAPSAAPGEQDLRRFPCVLPSGHHGGCLSREGHVWVRLGELLWFRGQVLEGTRVRNL